MLAYSYIRFSSKRQREGDSRRRQLEETRKYCTANGLTLDESFSLKDEGLSAYSGAHLEKGALGVFLALVKQNKIPRGSVLIIESLDRLSRQQILPALNLFTQIIEAGVTIVTLFDRMEYTAESINANPFQLTAGISIMQRANEESATKSKRLKAVWVNKRKEIDKQKLTSKGPNWVRLNKDKTEFERIPERCAIVASIFERKLSGIGTERIAKELNQQDAWIPTRKGKKVGWRQSYVIKILQSASVIGHFQPSEWVDGKREAVGEVIRDYYPQVISDEVFYSAQKQFAENQKNFKGGRTGKLNNLFSHLGKCGYCGGSMVYVDKNSKKSSGRYLVCDNARRKQGCSYYSLRYPKFEELVLSYSKGLNADQILPGAEQQQTELAFLRGNLARIETEIETTNRQIENLTNHLSNNSDERIAEHLKRTLAEKFDIIGARTSQKTEAEEKLIKLQKSSQDIAQQILSIQELQNFMVSKTGEELINIRTKLRQEIRNLVEKIVIYPVGKPRMTRELVEEMIGAVLEVDPNKTERELERFRRDLEARIDNKDYCEVWIYFKTGKIRMLKYGELLLEFDKEENAVRSREGGVLSEYKGQ